MKKLLFFTFLVAFICCSGCSARGVADSQLREDLQPVLTEYLAEALRIDGTCIHDIEIVRSQKNDKQQTVYCDVSTSSNFYDLTLHLLLDYEYYDKGGWYLSSWEETDGMNYEIIQPDERLAKSILLQYLNRGDFCELSEDSMNLENSELTNDHKSAFYQFSINDKKDLFSFIGPVSLNLSINTEEPGQYWWSTGDDYDPTSIEKIPNIDGTWKAEWTHNWIDSSGETTESLDYALEVDIEDENVVDASLWVEGYCVKDWKSSYKTVYAEYSSDWPNLKCIYLDFDVDSILDNIDKSVPLPYYKVLFCFDPAESMYDLACLVRTDKRTLSSTLGTDATMPDIDSNNYISIHRIS